MAATNDRIDDDATVDLAEDGAQGVSMLERMDAASTLALTWRQSVIEVRFRVGEQRMRIDTDSAIEPHKDGEVRTVHGKIGQGRFAFEITNPLFDAMASTLPDAVELDALAPDDAAILIEYMLGDALGAVEKEVGEKVELESVEDGPLVSELEPIVASVWIEKLRVPVRAVFMEPLHMRILTEWLRPLAMSDEYDAGADTRVEIGPIVLDAGQFADLEPGDALAIGTEPGKNLEGRLIRLSGRTVPIRIDTAHVTALGPVEDPVTEELGEDEIELGIAIGTVRLTPAHLKRASEGSRFIMERNADNKCALIRDGDVVATGELTLLEGQLAVEVLSIGGRTAPASAPVAYASVEEPTDDEFEEEGAFDDQDEADAIENATLPIPARRAG